MYLALSFIFVTITVSPGSANSHVESRRKVVNRHRPQMLTFFKGTIAENADFVELASPIFALDKDAPKISGKICDYKIYSDLSPVPFKVMVLNKTTGEAEIILSDSGPDLNCLKTPRYNFSITAIDCGTGNLHDQFESLKSTVIIDVIDVNDNEPVFEELHYSATFSEGDIDNILHVRAVDTDCTPRYNLICKYSIKHDHSGLFSVDRNGTISMQPRDTSLHTTASKHSFNVVASDCGGLTSQPARVTITILPNCNPSWSGISKRVEYSSLGNEKTRVLFPSAQLSTCIKDDDIDSLTLTVDLDTSYIGKGCDRDTRSSATTASMCDTNKLTVFDFLPTIENYNKKLEQENEKSGFVLPLLKKSHSSEAEHIYKFDGESEIFNITDVHTDVDGALRNGVFSISMWLKTTPSSSKKEHFTILSKSNAKGDDGDFILHMKNCRLNLLTRTRDTTTEWNWKLSTSEICDNLWHHYVIKVDVDKASLLLDGTLSHRVNAVIRLNEHTSNTKQVWVVGAMWKLRGGKNHFSYRYEGLMAGLTIYSGSVDNNLAKCATECQEGLYLPDYILDMASIEISKSTLKATMTKGDFESTSSAVLSHLSYYNNRTFPTSRERELQIKSSIVCKNSSIKCHEIEDMQSHIIVLQSPNPAYTISGVDHIARSANSLQEGINTFQIINIWAAIDDSSPLSSVDGSPIHQIDECQVLLDQDEISGEEMLFVRPQKILTDNNLVLTKQKNGIKINGLLNLSGYESVLRSIVYQHSLPKDLSEQKFSVKCSELNGRFETNKHLLTLTVLHPSTVLKQPHIAGIKKAQSDVSSFKQKMQPQPEMLQLSLKNDVVWEKTEKHSVRLKNEDSNNDSVMLTVLIVGVCLALLALIVAAMMIQSHLFRSEEEQLPILDDEYEDEKEEINDPEEMDWDDSALTITVNPLQLKGCATDCSENEFSDLEYEDVNENRQMYHRSKKENTGNS